MVTFTLGGDTFKDIINQPFVGIAALVIIIVGIYFFDKWKKKKLLKKQEPTQRDLEGEVGPIPTPSGQINFETYRSQYIKMANQELKNIDLRLANLKRLDKQFEQEYYTRIKRPNQELMKRRDEITRELNSLIDTLNSKFVKE